MVRSNYYFSVNYHLRVPSILSKCVSITVVELACFISFPLRFRVIVIASPFAPRYDNNRGLSRCSYNAGTIIILYIYFLYALPIIAHRQPIIVVRSTVAVLVGR